MLNKRSLTCYKPDAFSDMFLAMDPQSFSEVAKALSALSTSNKDGFNAVLDKFDRLKDEKPESYDLDTIIKRHYFRKDVLNELFAKMLCYYWEGQDKYSGGYLKRLLPVKKQNESKAVYQERYCVIWETLIDLMILTLDECDYFVQPLWMNEI